MNIKTDVKGLTSTMPTGTDATSIAQNGAPLSKLAKELMDSGTAPIIDAYAKGSNFEIGDNTKLYQIVKDVKNIIDMNFLNRGNTSYSFGFSIDVKSHAVVFNLVFDNTQASSDGDNKLARPDLIGNAMDFAEKLVDTMEFTVKRKYQDSVDCERKVEEIMGTDSFMGEIGKINVQFIVRERAEEDK
jgi:hypothetical protein